MAAEWESLDWEVLDRLRSTFLHGDKTAGPYWHTITDLECYNRTYAERIGWKWDAVLLELQRRGWSPRGGTVLDWGCGSGVASRRVLAAFGAGRFSRLIVHDHSRLAVDYTLHHAPRHFPRLAVLPATPAQRAGAEPIDLLVLSHVINELDADARVELERLCHRAAAILWVEPGTHEVSRLLGTWRERLRAAFTLVAPCPHQEVCGMLRPGNERHWCHFFAAPPAGVQSDSGWVKFGQRAGIDLRSLPYAFLALDRSVGAAPEDVGARVAGASPADAHSSVAGIPSCIIGEPRVYKGYAKIFNCDAHGVTELMLQKRDDPVLFKSFKHGAGPQLHRWTHENGRITQITSEPATNSHQ